MTEDPVQQLQTVIRQIQEQKPPGWTAKLGSGGTWTINAPGGTVRVTDLTAPAKATSALTRLRQHGLPKALAKPPTNGAPARGKQKVHKVHAKPSTAPFQAPTFAAPGNMRPPAYPGDPSPDEGPVRRRVLLTPALARELLDRPWEATTSEGISLRQRDLDPSTVQEFADLINRDRFKLTYQGLGIGLNGSYYDGQHRSHAVILTGKSVWVWINYNVHPDEIEAYDGGRQRRTSTRLGMECYDHPLLLGSAARLLYNYFEWEAVPEEAKAWVRWYMNKVSDPVLRDLVHAEPDLYEAVKWTAVQKQPRGVLLNPTAISVFRFLVRRKWPQGEAELDGFLDAVVTGVGIDSPEHEAMYIRDWLGRNAKNPVISKYCHVEAHLVLLIGSWNRFIKGQPAKKIPGGLWSRFPKLYTPTD